MSDLIPGCGVIDWPKREEKRKLVYRFEWWGGGGSEMKGWEEGHVGSLGGVVNVQRSFHRHRFGIFGGML